jgi:spermidine synthase
VGKVLNADPRCHYVHGSFFDLAIADDSGFDPAHPGQLFDAILLDIDHSPSAFLNQANAGFYTTDNLRRMARQLRTGGVFAMWSNELPDEAFLETLRSVFQDVRAEVITFYNPFQNGESTNSVYLGIKPPIA